MKSGKKKNGEVATRMTNEVAGKITGKNVRKTAEKNTERKKKIWQDKRMVAGVVTVLIVVIVVILAVVSATYQEPIPDGYFVSDDTKLVLSLPAEVSSFEENPDFEPMVTRIVYEYDDDKITGAKIYFEYENADLAKEADRNITMDQKDWATSRRVNGKYIVFGVKPEQYSGMTATQVRDDILSMQAAGAMVENDE